ncbi:MAG: hypothetical protein WDN00_01430 [Limisphaerales bacterium]
MMTMAAWAVGGLIALYLLIFAAIVLSNGRVARAFDAVGISGRVLDFFYGWLIDLVFGP